MRASPINVGAPSQAVCQCCLKTLPLEDFPKRSDRSGRFRPYCRQCARDGQRARYEAHKRESPFKLKVTRARSRSQFLQVPFDLDAEYLESIWTGTCPVLGAPIFLNETSRSDEFAAELDRFVPWMGYVRGNVAFLSRRANRLKNNVTTAELEQLITWMKQYENGTD